MIELEAERCSLDSLGAFTDEHYCGPAVTRSMHTDDLHSQMWVGSDSELTPVVLFIQIFTGIPNGKNKKHIVARRSRLLLRLTNNG